MDNSNNPSYRRSVMTLQQYLLDISRSDTDIPRVNPDGIYGPTTESAVQAFQRKYMQKPSGRVDFDTWRELMGAAKAFREEQSPPESISPFSMYLKDGRLVPNDKSDLVAIVKIMLASMAMTYPFAEDMILDDLYDRQTEEATKIFQQIHDLPVTGYIDKQTWNLLAKAYMRSLSIE